MQTLVRSKAARPRNLPRGKVAKSRLALSEIERINAISVAAARDLETRSAATDADEAALVNAVARAAARSLIS